MFYKLFSIVNIFDAWNRFKSGKCRKKDVTYFEFHLEDNLFSLHEDIIFDNYRHSDYEFFQIFDNKKRDIYKAEVRDRVVHQIVYDYLTSLYEKDFITDSYSSRGNKGHHKAVETLRYFIKIAGSENRENIFVLKCDIKKYFDSINHFILLRIIKRKVSCPKTFFIIEKIIYSFNGKFGSGSGIPLGNITSQIFANIYLHSLDVFVKKNLGCRFYVRYNDDFVIVSNNQKYLEIVRLKIMDFVSTELQLQIPIDKTSIRKAIWGIDFLGYVVLSDSVLLRNKTKGNIYTNIDKMNFNSYFGILQHCNSKNLRQKIFANIIF